MTWNGSAGGMLNSHFRLNSSARLKLDGDSDTPALLKDATQAQLEEMVTNTIKTLYTYTLKLLKMKCNGQSVIFIWFVAAGSGAFQHGC